MRATTIFSVLFFLSISFTNAQSPSDRIQIKDNKIENKGITFNAKQFTGIDFRETKNLFDLSHSKTISWKWDTLYTYDTTNLFFKRNIRTFDINGNVSTYINAVWVSGVWKNNSKQTFTHDLFGNETKWIVEIWDSIAWTNYYYQTKLYDVNNNLLTSKLEKWQNGSWLPNTKWTYTYDNNSNKLTELYEPDTSNHMSTKHRFLYTYDTNNNLIVRLFEVFQNNSWDSNEMDTYTYDNNNYLTNYLSMRWGTPFNYNRIVYINDTYGNVTSSIHDFSIDNVNWSDIYKNDYTYDLNNNVLSVLNTSFENNTWINKGKSIYTYNTNDYLLTQINKTWLSGVWVNTFRLIKTYDAADNILTESNGIWYNNIWDDKQRWTYTYDANGNSITGKYEQSYPTGFFHPALIGEDDINVYSNKSIVDYVSYAHRYSISFKSILDINNNLSDNNLFRIFPNPANEIITIDLNNRGNLQNTTISIYDMQGKILLKQAISQQQTEFNVSQFARGIYVVKVYNDRNAFISKFVKE